MKTMMIAAFMLIIMPQPMVKYNGLEIIVAETTEHSGGCRKNSPIGLCCHKERATGFVHCH